MLLTIIVPSYNQGRFIARTLDSIFSQEYRPLEVIVIDGASTDNTIDILKQYQQIFPSLKWVSEEDEGPADAVNKGLAMATGDIAAIQSSDDIYYPGAFEAVAKAFNDNPQCGFVIGHYCGIDANDKVIYTEKLPLFSWEAYFGLALCIPQSSIFFRMQVADKVGGWNGEYYGCDLDYWLRILLVTQAYRIDRILSGWRIYEGARTHSGQNERIWRDYWRMIENNAELKKAPSKVRRLANASRHIFALRFPPSGNLWLIRWHLLQGLIKHPTFWRYQKMGDMVRLIPGYVLVRSLVRQMRRYIP